MGEAEGAGWMESVVPSVDRFNPGDAVYAQRPAIGKTNTQKIERKHLTLRTRTKRLAGKTIGFFTSVLCPPP